MECGMCATSHPAPSCLAVQRRRIIERHHAATHALSPTRTEGPPPLTATNSPAPAQLPGQLAQLQWLRELEVVLPLNLGETSRLLPGLPAEWTSSAIAFPCLER